MTFEKVQEIIREQLFVADDKEIKMESRLVEDLAADSLDIVEILMGLEANFEIEIPDEEVEKFLTVGDITRYLKRVQGAESEDAL